MKNFKLWKDVLSEQTVFSTLSESEIEQLLQEEVSKERDYPQGREILKRGEFGDTCFVIGSGSVQVVVPENGGEATLSVLRQGEFFGEMALFEKKPRAATVRANEDCTLLEIRRQEFLKVLREHGNVASEVLLGLSERLRHTNDQVTALKMKGMDEKLSQFSTKLEAEVKGISSALREAQALVGHTKSHADDIIGSFERTRTWLTWMAFFVIGIITVGGVGGGVYGIAYLKGLYDRAEGTLQDIEASKERAVKLDEFLFDKVLIPQFRRAVTEEEATAVAAYETLAEYKHLLTFMLPLNAIQHEIEHQIGEREPRSHTLLLLNIFDDAKAADKHTETALAYYLILTNQILVENETFLTNGKFAQTLSEFKDYVSDNQEYIEAEYLPDLNDRKRLQELFANESEQKEGKFKEVAGVLPIL